MPVSMIIVLESGIARGKMGYVGCRYERMGQLSRKQAESL